MLIQREHRKEEKEPLAPAKSRDWTRGIESDRYRNPLILGKGEFPEARWSPCLLESAQMTSFCKRCNKDVESTETHGIL